MRKSQTNNYILSNDELVEIVVKALGLTGEEITVSYPHHQNDPWIVTEYFDDVSITKT